MDKTPIRFIHVDQDFALSGDGVKLGTTAYTHAAIMRSLMRLKNLCDDQVLTKVPGIESDLAAIVITQHELYSQLLLVNSNDITDEEAFEKRLIQIKEANADSSLDISGASQRVFPRYKTEMEMLVQIDGHEYFSKCSNISLDGVCLSIDGESIVKGGDQVEMIMKGKSLELKLTGKVSWAFNNNKVTQAGILLHFSEIEALTPWLKIITALHLRQHPSQSI